MDAVKVKLSGEAGRKTEYFRILRGMLQNGKMLVNSNEIAEIVGVASSQVRADLAHYSGCGYKGRGYSVKLLYKAVSIELGAGDGMKVGVFGKCDFLQVIESAAVGRGMTFLGIFDGDNIPRGIDIAVICECENPQKMADKLVSSGVKSIWNLTQANVCVNLPNANLPLGDILMALSGEIRKEENK